MSIRIRLDSKSVNTYSFDGLTSGVVAQPAVIFTFDKGLSSLYSQAFSYMQSRNVRGTGYIPTNLVGNTGQATWAQLQADVYRRVDDRQPDDVECRSDDSESGWPGGGTEWCPVGSQRQGITTVTT